MGFSPDQDKYEVEGILPEEFHPIPDLDVLFSHACAARPDIGMARKQVEESERILALERKRVFRDVEAGPAYAHDTDGADLLGPEIKMQLPLFDQNQAQIAKAEYRTRQARKEFQNRIGILREEVSSTLKKVLLARREIDLIRDTILPARSGAVRYADEYVDAMQLNPLHAFEARQKLFESRRDLLEALREHRNQEIELERVLGGRIPATEKVHE
jgi:outer membrane protein TolC